MQVSDKRLHLRQCEGSLAGETKVSTLRKPIHLVQTITQRAVKPTLVAGMAALLTVGCSDSDDSSDSAGSSGPDWSGAKASMPVLATTCTATLTTRFD